MIRRVLVAIVAVAVLGGALAAWSQKTFPDVPEDHPHRADIDLAVGRGWFTGYDDGTFRPDSAVRDEHIARVVKRALGSGKSRAEFATFMRGGADALAASSTTTTTQPSGRGANYYAVNFWGGLTCEQQWEAITGADWGYGEGPEVYDVGGYLDQSDVAWVEGWYKRIITESYFSCQGTAILEDAREVKIFIAYGHDINADSDRGWHYYAFPRPNTLTCSAAAKTDPAWGLEAYNRVFLYNAKRDGDGDRIMCESVLKETGRIRIGDVPPGEVAL